MWSLLSRTAFICCFNECPYLGSSDALAQFLEIPGLFFADGSVLIDTGIESDRAFTLSSVDEVTELVPGEDGWV